MIKLRGHHLICLHFFQGEGYSKEFVANIGELLKKAKRGDEITVVVGADEVCVACPYLEDNRCAHKHDSEQEIRRLDDRALRLLNLKPGQNTTWQEIRLKTISAPSDWFHSFCENCDWESLCRKNLKQKKS